jgi:SH3 domain-containing YSC84-like protein 1
MPDRYPPGFLGYCAIPQFEEKIKMKYLTKRNVFGVIIMFVALCMTSVSANAQKDNKRLNDAARHSQAAATVFNEIMGVREKSIPKELLDRAEAIAVFPGVVKAAFIFGGHGGQGVISRRTKNGWDAPVFFNLSGGSFGAQIGAQKTDYVLLIMNEEGLKGLLEDKFEMGGEASIAAGPVGRTAAATTNATLDAGILSYSRTKGAFIGASLKGGVISPDNDLNEAIYDGKKAKEVLSSDRGMKLRDMPASVRIFPQTLARYSSRRAK